MFNINIKSDMKVFSDNIASSQANIQTSDKNATLQIESNNGSVEFYQIRSTSSLRV